MNKSIIVVLFMAMTISISFVFALPLGNLTNYYSMDEVLGDAG